MMKFTVEKNEIIDVLARIQGITGRKSNLAITENILIKSTESGLSISATDLETGFEGHYPAIIEEDGSMVINARKFYEIVKDFPGKTIFVHEVKDRWFEIGNEKVNFRIVGMNSEDFPDIPKIEDQNLFFMDSSIFKRMIEKIIFIGFAGDEKRAHIIGLNFEVINDEHRKLVRLVSTDGKRLSKVDWHASEQNNLPATCSALVFKKGLAEASKFLESEGNVRIGIIDNQFVIKKEFETIILSLLEGDFPAYEDFVKIGEGNIVIDIDKQLFKMMLKRMSILASDEYRAVVFKFNNGTFEISTTNPEIGESKEDMKIDYAGEEIEIAFNPNYFLETLNHIESERVFLNIRDKDHPCILQGDTENDKLYLSLIMPMKI